MNFRSRSNAPDLQSQLEELLNQVWRCEADWRLWDRLDAVERQDALRQKRRNLATKPPELISVLDRSSAFSC